MGEFQTGHDADKSQWFRSVRAMIVPSRYGIVTHGQRGVGTGTGVGVTSLFLVFCGCEEATASISRQGTPPSNRAIMGRLGKAADPPHTAHSRFQWFERASRTQQGGKPIGKITAK